MVTNCYESKSKVLKCADPYINIKAKYCHQTSSLKQTKTMLGSYRYTPIKRHFTDQPPNKSKVKQNRKCPSISLFSLMVVVVVVVVCVCVCVCACVRACVSACVCVCVCRERERDRQTDRQNDSMGDRIKQREWDAKLGLNSVLNVSCVV